jgi:hypothetical protein
MTATFKPRFQDGSDDVSITGHDMKFDVDSVTVIYWWNGDWTTQTLKRPIPSTNPWFNS